MSKPALNRVKRTTLKPLQCCEISVNCCEIIKILFRSDKKISRSHFYKEFKYTARRWTDQAMENCNTAALEKKWIKYSQAFDQFWVRWYSQQSFVDNEKVVHVQYVIDVLINIFRDQQKGDFSNHFIRSRIFCVLWKNLIFDIYIQ